MQEIKNYNLPIHTNSLYEKEAISSIGLTKEIADKINELVKAYNELSKADLKWKQEQEGIIRKGVIFMKDNLYNSIAELLNSLDMSKLLSGDVKAQVFNRYDDLKAQIEKLVSGSPSGAFATLSLLNQYGNKNKLYVVSADNGWYYYDGQKWCRGGDYMQSFANNYAIAGGSIRHSCINLTSKIIFNESEKKLTFPYPVYYANDLNVDKLRVSFLDTDEKDFVLDLSQINDKALYFIVYDENSKHITYKTSQDAWANSYRVILYYIDGEFYGVNASCVEVTGGNIEKTSSEKLDALMKKDLKNIKFIGDSIVAGSGASDYSLTNNVLFNNYYIASQTNPCFANLLGAYLVNKANGYNVIAPSDKNMTISGTYSFAANKNAVSYFVCKCFKRLAFTCHCSNIELNLQKYKDAGIVQIIIDGVIKGTIDLYNDTETFVNIPYSLNDGKHTVEIELIGANPLCTSNNAVFRIGGATITRDVKFLNYGISGFTSYYIDSYLDKLVSDSDDLVVLSIGTNDRLSYFEDTTEMFVDSILNKLKDKHVILLSPIPSFTEGNYKSTIVDIVNRFNEIAQRHNITYINIHDCLIDYCKENNISVEALLNDGLHPNNEGYRVMFEIIKKKLYI